MGKKENTKAKEKKAEIKAMKDRWNKRVANVKLANSVEDPLALLPKPFSVYNKNGLDLNLETVRAPEVEDKTKDWAYNLVETNMKPVYDLNNNGDPDMEEFGWDGMGKQRELREDLAWYLIARTQEGTPVAFSHFRYELYYNDEVVYCHELHVEKTFRRKGLGRFMMKVLEMLAIKADMLKVLVTIFRNDQDQFSFFKNALNFDVDETNFAKSKQWQRQYGNLSRHNLIKKKKVEEEEGKIKSQSKLLSARYQGIRYQGCCEGYGECC